LVPLSAALFPFTTLFRSGARFGAVGSHHGVAELLAALLRVVAVDLRARPGRGARKAEAVLEVGGGDGHRVERLHAPVGDDPQLGDRKSTRLNSSHVAISY